MNAMKKIYLAATALLIAATTQAQVEDFESYSLSGPESYDNGQTNGGDFQIGYFNFTNVYTVDTMWGDYWSGFAVSNVTDNVNPGPANQYGNIWGSGNSGDNFILRYNSGTITSLNPSSVAITGFYITNTTYAAISMRDGDAFAKKFGSIYAADGVTVDGTNGEDFFRVWIYGEDETGTQMDSVEFYLADYRFADSTQDYILDRWEEIDLSGFGFPVTKLSFKLESSDVGQWGMNTPAYFAIDDIAYTSPVSTVELSLTNVKVYPNPVENLLNVSGENGVLELASSSGQIVYQGDHKHNSAIDVSNIPSGVYFLTLENEKGRFVEKIVK